MDNQPRFPNKRISTPIGIIITILTALLAGGIIAWQYWGMLGEVEEKVVEPEIAIAPRIDLEATVISLTLSSEDDCGKAGYSPDKCPFFIYPLDKGMIKVDKIISCEEGTPPDNMEIYEISKCNELPFEEGDEIEVKFYYSSRPAKIIMIPPTEVPTLPPETPVSAPDYNTPIGKENGYFLYKFENTLVTEETVTFLPGLETGSKFRAVLSGESIREYEIIP